MPRSPRRGQRVRGEWRSPLNIALIILIILFVVVLRSYWHKRDRERQAFIQDQIKSDAPLIVEPTPQPTTTAFEPTPIELTKPEPKPNATPEEINELRKKLDGGNQAMSTQFRKVKP